MLGIVSTSRLVSDPSHRANNPLDIRPVDYRMSFKSVLPSLPSFLPFCFLHMQRVIRGNTDMKRDRIGERTKNEKLVKSFRNLKPIQKRRKSSRFPPRRNEHLVKQRSSLRSRMATRLTNWRRRSSCRRR